MEHGTSPLGQAIVTVVVGLVASIVSSVVFFLATGYAFYVSSISGVLIVIIGWKSVLWIGLTAAITWRLRAAPPGRRARLYAAAAVVAALAVQLAPSLPPIVSQGASTLLFIGIPALLGAGAFGACAGVGAIAGVRLGTDARAWRTHVLRIVAVALIVLTGALILALPVFWFSSSVAILGPGKTPTAAEADHYAVVAIAAIASAIAVLVIGVVTRTVSIRTWGIVLLSGAVLFGFLFQVPPGRFFPEPGGSGYVDSPGNSDCQADPSRPGCGG